MIQGAMNSLMGGNQTSQSAGQLGPLYAVEQGSPVPGGLSFPSDLGTQALYIKFDFIKRKRGRRTASSTERALGSIFLPLPPSLNDQFQSNYTQEGVGMFGEMGRELGDKISSIKLDEITMEGVQGIIEGSLKYQGTNLLSKPTAAAGLIAGTLGLGAPGAAMVAGATSAARGALVGEGIAINPYLTQIFTGVNLKSHAFQFKLVPKSLDEAETLKAIIHQFKRNMLPSLQPEGQLATAMGLAQSKHIDPSKGITSAQKRMMFSYPNEWRIKFSPSVAKNLYSIKPCVLTNVQVQYHGENKAFYFQAVGDSGAHPVSVTISLSFMETEIYTQEDVAAEGSGEATSTNTDFSMGDI